MWIFNLFRFLWYESNSDRVVGQNDWYFTNFKLFIYLFYLSFLLSDKIADVLFVQAQGIVK